MTEQTNSRAERVLDELIEAAEKVGLTVRRERIMREVGYRVRGGSCRLRNNDMVIIDRDQAPHEQLEIVAEALKRRDLEAVYLSPAARKILQVGPGPTG
jgi:ribonuclease P protein component